MNSGDAEGCDHCPRVADTHINLIRVLIPQPNFDALIDLAHGRQMRTGDVKEIPGQHRSVTFDVDFEEWKGKSFPLIHEIHYLRVRQDSQFKLGFAEALPLGRRYRRPGPDRPSG